MTGKCLGLSLLVMLSATAISGKEYHVSVSGNDANKGTRSNPFRTINFAARLAQPGDTITVHAGVYREWVNPAHGGESDSKRIVYRAAKNEKVEIKGSEIITGWERLPGSEGVWKVVIPNIFFGDYNPYKDTIHGDWFRNKGRIHHTGEVFLNGKSLYEKEALSKVLNPLPDTTISDLTGSVYTWYCESDSANTLIWCNFRQFNPNRELIEISTRRTCFFPIKQGINYLTIQGFHFSQAATQWAAPTAGQVGMVATHWNKGWIIEHNVIHDTKCAGITLGKERGTGHNVWSANPAVGGATHYIEVIFRTLYHGWNKENIGSHIVRNNEIYNCEQAGICGSMGAAFSLIEHNHIYNITVKKQFSGAEMAGIKLHGAIDTWIINNRIHGSTDGIWLDWMAQGTRVSSNLLYNNSAADLELEVNHGPTLIDNNLLLSRVGIVSTSQGTAYVHNLIAGQVAMWSQPERSVPYHLPHSTSIAGFSPIVSGDDRYCNNIFLGYDPQENIVKQRFNFPMTDYEKAELPVWINGNVYYGQAVPNKKETRYVQNSGFNSDPKVREEGGHVYLQFSIDDTVPGFTTQLISTDLLGKALFPNAAYENPDGSPLVLDKDYLGTIRSKENCIPGPFVNLAVGRIELKVW
jgi:hypothetical protein